jgi:hypothetical protein
MNSLLNRSDGLLATPQATLDHHTIFNPSLVAFGGRLLCSFRACTSEYVNGQYLCRREHDRFYNEIILGHLDSNFSVLDQKLATAGLEGPLLENAPNGFQDCRLFASPDGKTLRAFASILSRRPSIGKDRRAHFDDLHIRIGELTFAADLSLSRLTLYGSPAGLVYEKNWSPFYVGDDLYAVYFWDPLIILRLGPAGAFSLAKSFEPVRELANLRGSSTGVRHGDGWLFLTHQRYEIRGKVYFDHRLVELGSDFAPRRASEEFHFLSQDILEYGMSLALHEDRLLFSFGIAENGCRVLAMRREEIEKMLRPVRSRPKETDPAETLKVLARQMNPSTLKERLEWKFRRKKRQLAALWKYRH